MSSHHLKHIIISRADKIGDVVLTLPMAGIIKTIFPGIKITFLGNSYTKSIIGNSSHINHFLNWDEIKENAVEALKQVKADAIIHVFPHSKIAKSAKKAGIPIRIGTSHRIFHWFACNKLINLSRKNSELHEAQLNIKLLAPLGIKKEFSLSELPKYYGFNAKKEEFPDFIVKEKFNLIIHPKSKGSAREWPIQNFYKLAQRLSNEKFNIIISGTSEEREIIEKECPQIFLIPSVKNAAGKVSLIEFIQLIKSADGLIACSTGPLHIAAALGIFSLGLYPPIRPMHPGRWAPIGEKAHYLVKDINCSLCRNGHECICLNEISVDAAQKEIEHWQQNSEKNSFPI